MKKKKRKNITFEQYWEDYINEVIKRKFSKTINEHQSEIKQFRDEQGIRKGGFKNKRQKNKWWKSQLKEPKRASEIVYEHIVEVGIKTKGFEILLPEELTPKKTDIQIYRVGKGFFYVFRQAVAELAYQIKLDLNWVLALENYITTNKINMGCITDTGIKISEKIYKINSFQELGRQVCLTFGPNTRLEDIQLIWQRQVSPILKTLPGYLPHPPRKKREKK